MPDEPRLAAAAMETGLKPTPFRMRAQLLDDGRSNIPLAETGNMWARLKVYASGGENTRHAHPNEDHMFVVLAGEAVFFGPNGEETALGRNQGNMLPAGCLYRFRSTAEEPLVLLRVGCAVNDRGGHKERTASDGGSLPGKSRANRWQAPVYRADAYYE